MAKGIFAFSMVVFILMTAFNVGARERTADVDGCSTLAELVENSVLQSAVGKPAGIRQSRSSALPDSGGSSAIDKYCESTAASTTIAFSKAMADIGLTVRWVQPTAVSGDYCFSHYLSQCYPATDFLAGANSAAQLAYVNDAWKAVRTGVSEFGARGAGSDFIFFTADQLRQSLDGATERYVDDRRPVLRPNAMRHERE